MQSYSSSAGVPSGTYDSDLTLVSHLCHLLSSAVVYNL